MSHVLCMYVYIYIYIHIYIYIYIYMRPPLVGSLGAASGQSVMVGSTPWHLGEGEKRPGFFAKSSASIGLSAGPEGPLR